MVFIGPGKATEMFHSLCLVHILHVAAVLCPLELTVKCVNLVCVFAMILRVSALVSQQCE